jgi:N-acetylneuraminic acid mutarotase
VQADQYRGNGDTGFGGAIGNGTLTLSDDGTNISGALTVGGSMNDVLVLYIQTGPGGFTNTSGFSDQGDSCRQAISGVSASGRSLLTFAGGFQPNYAIALAPAAAGTGGLWQLANGGNNSLVYLGSVNLAPLNNTGPYTFSFPAALFGMIPGMRSTIQVFGTYVGADGSRSTEAIAGDLTGTQGWNPFTQTTYTSYTFDAGAVLVKLPLGVWSQRPGSVPVACKGATAVWTGSEMIVWGGTYGSFGNVTYLNDGGRYNPVANVWTTLPTSGAPAARAGHTAVWTGTELIVWGGASNTTFYADGGRYNPTANSWTPVQSNGAPAGRQYHTAVWTGSEMIVWGGYYSSGGTHYLNDGARFSPAANTWTTLSATGAPGARRQHTAVWTGSDMIVWGGYSGGYMNDGARYNPVAGSWTALATAGAPAGRNGHTAVWTGSDMIVWGGYNGGYMNNGARYNPVAGSWTALPTAGALAGRNGHTAVWTGSDMIVWGGYNGGYFNDGGRYNPAANSWTALPTTGAPGLRTGHVAAWSGSEMIVWGGSYTNYLNDGGRYNPAANSWTALIVAPIPRTEHTAVWTGSEMIIWGGGYVGSSWVYLNDGGRYNPAANSWMALPTTEAPTARQDQTAVWTGSEMIVWGGTGGSTSWLNDGGRYNPANNSWTAVPTNGAPARRYRHTAVWTGNEMIVWGGYNGIGSATCFNDGGRYNPMANSWTALPTTGAPAGRQQHTAVWTGSEMIVWGGYYWNGSGSTYLNDGGRYNPITSSWTDLSTSGGPTARVDHTAVWTGSEMIIWGGYYWNGSDSTYLSDGGRYNPANDSWTGLSTSGSPTARSYHTAVWTGNEMILWGGSYWNGSSYTYLNDGGRYSPAGNNWAAMPSAGAPAGRQTFTAVWTGSEMIVFGGYGDSGYMSDPWSYYPYAPAVRITQTKSASADVAWPVWSSSLRLCQTTNLAAGQWTTVTNAPTQVGEENHVTVSPLSGRQFFRVEYPWHN